VTLLSEFSVSINSVGGLHPYNLRCERLLDPLSIDKQNPHLSWISQSQQRAQKQTTYQILVASNMENLNANNGDLWDSKKVASDQSYAVIYSGKQLTSGTDCFWKVKTWDKNGKESEWSQPAHWSMGLLLKNDWKGQWIGLDTTIGKDDAKSEFRRLSARFLRKEFKTTKTIKRAVAYVCGLGLFELYVNGQKIGDQVLIPALSEYNKRAYYITFDITSKLKHGKNALGVILGNGRFFAPRNKNTTTYGFPKLLLQLNIEYIDGSTESIVSDQSWKLTADGPIVANNEYDGEEYDATKELTGWDAPGFDDSNWMKPDVVKPGSPKICSQMTEPIKVMETIKPVSVKEVKPGVFIFDMGQNMVGWVSMKVQGEKGRTVTLRFAETLQSDGTLNLANIRLAQVTDIYTLKGKGTEAFEPRFTYHGFRFVEMKGFPGNLDLSTIEGKVVYDNMQTLGLITTSNETINTIYKNAYWGIRGNYRSIPTDCPQRDERQGWLGDRAIGSKGESYIFDNAKLYAKWLQDIDDAQRKDGSIPNVAPTYWKLYDDNVTWPGTYLIIANMLYAQYGNVEPIRKHYDSMRKWVLYMKNNYLKEGILIKDVHGDWCMPPENPLLIHSQDPQRQTSGEILSTTYYCHMLWLMQRFAYILGKPEDVQEYQSLAESVKAAYNHKFFNAELNQYGNNTVTANTLSLAFDLVPDNQKEAVFQNVVDKTLGDFRGHISTGLVGTQWISRIFTQYGRAEITYRLATNTDYPSWGYMAKKGATTIWELWNGDTADSFMNSGNHVMLLGDLIIWFYENLAGIKSDEEYPGFKNIIMKPTITGDLKFVKASYQSTYGEIKSEWDIRSGQFVWNVSIPANATATVYLPIESESDAKEGGLLASSAEGVKFLKMENRSAVFEVGSGSYSFSSKKFVVIKPEKELVDQPTISPINSAAFNNIFVSINSTTPGAEIRFTRNGTEPDETSELYRNPFILSKSAVICAKAFKKNYQTSYKSISFIEICDPKTNGLNYSYYEGNVTWKEIPDFSRLSPMKKGITLFFDPNKIQHRPRNFGIYFGGFLLIEKDAEYTFYLLSKDGSKLLIDGKELINNDGLHQLTQSTGTVQLTTGKHKLEVLYFFREGRQGEGGLLVEYSAPEIPRRTLPASKLFTKE
jgi:alpha-L-rhamnosidase